MDSDREGDEEEVFRRQPRISRSPIGSTTSLPEQPAEGGRLLAEALAPRSRKRKEVTPPQGQVQKRTAAGGDGDDIEEEESDYETRGHGVSGHPYQCLMDLDKIVLLTNEVMQYTESQRKSKKMVTEQVNMVKSMMNTVLTLADKVRIECAEMKGRLFERSKIEKIVKRIPERVEAPRVLTYAEASRVPKIPKVTGVSRVIAPKVIFVRSSDENKSLEDVKAQIKSAVKPSKLGLNIKRVIKTGRGVMIEAEGTEQLEKISTCKDLVDKGLVFDQPKKRSPRIMVYDVDGTELDELADNIYEQNVKDAEIDVETFKKECKRVHSYAKRDPNDTRVNVVLECTARVRNLLRVRDRLYIGWQSCRVKDYNPLVRCYSCQAFGHVAKYCKGKSVCSHCAGDHEFKDCKNRDRPAKCANCVAQKRDANHVLGHARCPEFIRATKIAYERIDYGA